MTSLPRTTRACCQLTHRRSTFADSEWHTLLRPTGLALRACAETMDMYRSQAPQQPALANCDGHHSGHIETISFTHRHHADQNAMLRNGRLDPWFGIEQEYTLMKPGRLLGHLFWAFLLRHCVGCATGKVGLKSAVPLGFNADGSEPAPQGPYYTGLHGKHEGAAARAWGVGGVTLPAATELVESLQVQASMWPLVGLSQMNTTKCAWRLLFLFFSSSFPPWGFLPHREKAWPGFAIRLASRSLASTLRPNFRSWQEQFQDFNAVPVTVR